MLNKKVLISVGLFGGLILLKNSCIDQLQDKKHKTIVEMDKDVYSDLSVLFDNLDKSGEYNLKRLIANNIRELMNCKTEARSMTKVDTIYQKFENYLNYVKISYSHLF